MIAPWLRRLLPVLPLLTSIPAGAETREGFDRRIIAELKARDPVAAELFVKANVARDRGDHAAAAGSESEDAWQLFEKRTDIEQEMTSRAFV